MKIFIYVLNSYSSGGFRMPYKDPEMQKKYLREYWRKRYYLIKEDPRKWKQYAKQNYERTRRNKLIQKEKIKEILGLNCFICNRDQKINWHEKNGKEHGAGDYHYIFKNVKDFVSLCPVCHRFVHKLMALYNKSWNDILLFLEK